MYNVRKINDDIYYLLSFTVRHNETISFSA